MKWYVTLLLILIVNFQITFILLLFDKSKPSTNEKNNSISTFFS